MRNSHRMAGLLMAATLAACGGSDTGMGVPSPPPPTPTPCTQSIVFHGTGHIPAHFADLESFTTTAMGRVDVTLDWTFPSTHAGFALTQGSCTFDQLKAGSCNFLLTLESPPKPLKGSAANVAAGSYGLWIMNGSDQDEAMAIQVVSSSSTCPPLASLSVRSETHDWRPEALRGGLVGIFRH